MTGEDAVADSFPCRLTVRTSGRRHKVVRQPGWQPYRYRARLLGFLYVKRGRAQILVLWGLRFPEGTCENWRTN